MIPLTRLTINLNCEKMGDYTAVANTFTAWKPSSVFCMNALNGSDPNNVVVRLHNLVSSWNGILIYRQYERGEDQLWKDYPDPETYLRKLRAFNLPTAWFNCGNEPGPKGADAIAMSKWYANLLKLNDSKGYNLRLVIPGGFATGSYEKNEVGWFQEMFYELGIRMKDPARRINGYSQIALGAHEYGMALPMFHTDGADLRNLIDRTKIQPPWKSKADVFDADNSDNWLIFRTEWYVDEIVRLTGCPRELVEVWLTEIWHDRIPHVVQKFPDIAAELDRLAGREMRGIRTIDRYLKWAFPQWTFGQALAEQFLWWENTAPAYYRGGAIFTGSYDDAWPLKWRQDYNVLEIPELLTIWPSYYARFERNTVATPIPTPTPKPTTTRVHARVKALPTGVPHRNFRPQPGSTVDLGDLNVGEEAYYYPQSPSVFNGGNWYYVESVPDGVAGWVLGTGIVWEAITTVPPPPTDTPEVAQLRAQVATLTTQLATATVANAALQAANAALVATLENREAVMAEAARDARALDGKLEEIFTSLEAHTETL